MDAALGDRRDIDYPIVIPAQAGIQAMADCTDAGNEAAMQKLCDICRAG